MGKLAATDRPCLRSLSHSFTLDVAVGIIGPKVLAEHMKEAIATFLWDELRLELNRTKTHLIHLPTTKARFLGYEMKAATARLRQRNRRRKGSPHNVVQTVKTNVGNIKLLVPLRDLTHKLKKYTRHGKPAPLGGSSTNPWHISWSTITA